MESRKILIVDDEIHILHVLSHKLTTGGFKVTAYQDAQIALQTLEELQPHLIIVDFQMPHWSGLEFCQQVRHHFDNNIPIILLTSRGLWLDESILTRAGVSRCVKKPFSPRKVMEYCHELLCAAPV